MKKQKSNKKLVVLLAIFIILTLILGGFVLYDKTIYSKSNNEYKNEENSNKVSSITNEIQSVYDEADQMLAEGSGIMDYNEVDIKVGKEGTVGGIINTKAYKLDLTKLEPYFTERAISFIKDYFTDTPGGHEDGNYYIFAENNIYSHGKKEFITTIFGQTDQSRRKLKVNLYDNNTVMAISEKSSYTNLDEYIVFKKVNNTWKIDMFETF